MKYTQQVEETNKSITTIQKADAVASQVAQNAEGALESAHQTVANIDRLSQDLSKQIEPLSQEIGVQRKLNASETGHLSADQINTLLVPHP